jgi:hypothetical protein
VLLNEVITDVSISRLVTWYQQGSVNQGVSVSNRVLNMVEYAETVYKSSHVAAACTATSVMVGGKYCRKQLESKRP